MVISKGFKKYKKILYNWFIDAKEKDDPWFTPGPNKYNPDSKSVTTTYPSWTISKTNRSPVENVNNPNINNVNSGPNDFTPLTGEGPKYSIRPKFNDDGTLDNKRRVDHRVPVPGPGSYDIEDKDKGIGYTFTLREPTKRKVKDPTSLPPVGTYDLRNDKSFTVPCHIFDKESRGLIKRKISKKKRTIELNPNYTILTTKSPKWTFSETERFFPKKKNEEENTIKIKKRAETPGPGHYPMRTFMGKEGPSFSFSREKYNHADAAEEAYKKKPSGPDPGKYSDMKYRPDTPRYTHGVRREGIVSKFKRSLPSPGEYNPKYSYLSNNITLPSWGFGNKEGFNKENSKSASKEKIVHIQFPGPGTYDVKVGRIPEGPKFSMGEITKKKKKDNFPGPGTYNSVNAHFPTEASYSMGKKYEDEHIKQVIKDGYPGPGSYKVGDVKLTNEIAFPKNQKEGRKNLNVPGPGAYRIPTAFDYISDLNREKGNWNPTFRYV